MTQNNTTSLYSQPFHLQLRHHLASLNIKKENAVRAFAQTHNKIDISPDNMVKLWRGNLPPTAKIATEIAIALGLTTDSYGERSLAYSSLINAASSYKEPKKLLADFIAVHEPESDYVLGKALGIDHQAAAYFKQHGTIAKYKYVKPVADALGLKGEPRKKFYQKTGWAVDNEHVMELLKEGTITLAAAIHCLCSIAELEKQQVAEMIGVNPTTFRGWTNSSALIPPMKSMKMLASEKLFGLSREQTRVFLAAAGYYEDKPHLCETMRYKTLTRKDVVRALVDIEGGDVEGYARKINVKPSLVYSWIDVSIPRERIISLLHGIERDDQQQIIEKAGHFLDIKDAMTRAQQTGTLATLMQGIKDIYDLTDDDFAITGTAIRGHCNQGEHMSPKSMSAIFADLEKRDPEFSNYWDDYKNLYIKELGLAEKEYRGKETLRKMDAELEKLRDSKSKDKAAPSKEAIRRKSGAKGV
jgi:hypothetical protein